MNEDPRICCLYSEKLVDTIMFLLKSPHYSPFGVYQVRDSFKRIEFQQGGRPNVHILLWLANYPRKVVSEQMPGKVNLIDKLYPVDPTQVERGHDQIYNIFTCYKRAKSEENKKCQFGAPFWLLKKTWCRFSCLRKMVVVKNSKINYSHEFEELDDLHSLVL